MITRVGTLTLVLLANVVTTATAADPEVVTFRTKDRMTITGDLWASGRKGAPAVIALHMYPADRTSWRPIAGPLTEAGIDLLAIDLRGYGDSARQGRKDLSEKVKARDAGLFRAMWRDALAAYAFLVERGSDPDRVAFLGASVGCSVAIDAAAREPRIRGAIVLTPGKDYLGVETMKHLKGYGTRPMLILSSEEEAGKGARPIADALGKTAEIALFDRTEIHGTRMFGSVPGVEGRIASWLAEVLGAPVALDGEIAKEERAGGDFGVWDMRADGNGRLTLKPVGRWIYAAVALESRVSAPERFLFAWAPGGVAERARRVEGAFGARGGRFTFESFESGSWRPVRGALPKDVRLGISTGKAVEILIPRTLEGLEREGRLKVSFGFARKASDILRVLPMGDQDMRLIPRWLDFAL